MPLNSECEVILALYHCITLAIQAVTHVSLAHPCPQNDFNASWSLRVAGDTNGVIDDKFRWHCSPAAR